MADYEFVQLTEGEWKEARDLRVQSVADQPYAFGQTPEEASAVSEEEWRRRLREDLYIFVRSEGALRGFGCLVLEKGVKREHIGWIYSIYIAPELRGQGAGRALVEHLIEEGMKRYPKLMKVMLDATFKQEAAIALYESLGFKKIGVLEKHLRVGDEYIDEWIMVKFVR